MNKIKRIIIALLVFLFLINLCACKDKKAESDTTNSNSIVVTQGTSEEIKETEAVLSKSKGDIHVGYVEDNNTEKNSVKEEDISALTTFKKENFEYITTKDVWYNELVNIAIIDSRTDRLPFDTTCAIGPSKLDENETVYKLAIKYEEDKTYETEFNGDGFIILRIDDGGHIGMHSTLGDITTYVQPYLSNN